MQFENNLTRDCPQNITNVPAMSIHVAKYPQRFEKSLLLYFFYNISVECSIDILIYLYVHRLLPALVYCVQRSKLICNLHRATTNFVLVYATRLWIVNTCNNSLHIPFGCEIDCY